MPWLIKLSLKFTVKVISNFLGGYAELRAVNHLWDSSIYINENRNIPCNKEVYWLMIKKVKIT